MTAVATSLVRVNRYLAGRGIASRRGADQLVADGRVRVNGRRVAPGTLVDAHGDTVTVDGIPVPPPVGLRTLMVNKPVGVVSTRSDTHARATVLDLVEEPFGLFPVGRLDADSRGLILLTSDGDLAMRLTHPRFGLLKYYRVTLRGRVSQRVLRAMVDGVALDDGLARAHEARLVEEGRGGDVVEMVMGEGRRREVRRLCRALGLGVADLQRVQLGPLRLGRLLESAARPLSPPEERALYAACGLPVPTRGAVRP